MTSAGTDPYDNATANLDKFGKKLVSLVKDLLASSSIVVSAVSYRVKSRRSAEDKVRDSLGKYNDASGLTDLLGLRVVTYFPDDVNAVCEVIKREFRIDDANSVDKRKRLDPDRFGYLSVHYIATLDDARARLPENSKFRSVYAEIQIRSILQHAWAEIEHDLGYKTKDAVPEDVRRRFSRLAGLLEVADTEFAAIRDERSRRANRVSTDIRIGASRVLLDYVSLTVYIDQDVTVSEVDYAISLVLRSYVADESSTFFVQQILAAYNALGIETINEIAQGLGTYRDDVIELVKLWAEWQPNKQQMRPAELSRGLSLTYLAIFMAAQKHEEENFEFYQWANNVLDVSNSIADSLLEAYRKSQE